MNLERFAQQIGKKEKKQSTPTTKKKLKNILKTLINEYSITLWIILFYNILHCIIP